MREPIDIGLLRRLAGATRDEERRVNVSRHFHQEEGELAAAIAYVDVRARRGAVKTFGSVVGYSGGGCFDRASFIIWPGGRVKVLDADDFTGLQDADAVMLDLITELLGDYYEWDASTGDVPVFNAKAKRLLRRVNRMPGERFIDESFDATRLKNVEQRWPIGYHFDDNR